MGLHTSVPNLVGRRETIATLGMGFGGIVLESLLAHDATAATSSGVRVPHFEPKAKSIIWLFMAGGVSHLESFDPKPALNEYAGKSISETPHKHVVESPLVTSNLDTGFGRKIMQTIFPLQVGFRPRGDSGIEVSDWWPNVGGCVDDLAIVRSMWTTDNNHQAQFQFHTGRPIAQGPHPSIGAWVHYGLGSLNLNLPQFVLLGNPVGPCCGGNLAHGADYLGPTHTGVRIDTAKPNAMPFLRPEGTLSDDAQLARFELISALHEQKRIQSPGDQELEARIESYELAFRMQRSIPGLLDLSDETQETQELYGLARSEAIQSNFAKQCLLSRRMVERGVRFVQILHGAGTAGSWDAHGKLKSSYVKLCSEVDQPIAALLIDLKRRGLLESTIVVFATEFGRTPGLEDFSLTMSREGRDHHPYGFSVWLAGGGIRGGVAHGATDELGFHAVEHRHYVTDVHATIMHQLGLEPRWLDVPGKKRIERDYGEVIGEILA